MASHTFNGFQGCSFNNYFQILKKYHFTKDLYDVFKPFYDPNNDFEGKISNYSKITNISKEQKNSIVRRHSGNLNPCKIETFNVLYETFQKQSIFIESASPTKIAEFVTNVKSWFTEIQETLIDIQREKNKNIDDGILRKYPVYFNNVGGRYDSIKYNIEELISFTQTIKDTLFTLLDVLEKSRTLLYRSFYLAKITQYIFIYFMIKDISSNDLNHIVSPDSPYYDQASAADHLLTNDVPRIRPKEHLGKYAEKNIINVDMLPSVICDDRSYKINDWSDHFLWVDLSLTSNSRTFFILPSEKYLNTGGNGISSLMLSLWKHLLIDRNRFTIYVPLRDLGNQILESWLYNIYGTLPQNEYTVYLLDGWNEIPSNLQDNLLWQINELSGSKNAVIILSGRSLPFYFSDWKKIVVQPLSQSIIEHQMQDTDLPPTLLHLLERPMMLSIALKQKSMENSLTDNLTETRLIDMFVQNSLKKAAERLNCQDIVGDTLSMLQKLANVSYQSMEIDRNYKNERMLAINAGILQEATLSTEYNRYEFTHELFHTYFSARNIMISLKHLNSNIKPNIQFMDEQLISHQLMQYCAELITESNLIACLSSLRKNGHPWLVANLVKMLQHIRPLGKEGSLSAVDLSYLDLTKTFLGTNHLRFVDLSYSHLNTETFFKRMPSLEGSVVCGNFIINRRLEVFSIENMQKIEQHDDSIKELQLKCANYPFTKDIVLYSNKKNTIMIWFNLSATVEFSGSGTLQINQFGKLSIIQLDSILSMDQFPEYVQFRICDYFKSHDLQFKFHDLEIIYKGRCASFEIYDLNNSENSPIYKVLPIMHNDMDADYELGGISCIRADDSLYIRFSYSYTIFSYEDVVPNFYYVHIKSNGQYFENEADCSSIFDRSQHIIQNPYDAAVYTELFSRSQGIILTRSFIPNAIQDDFFTAYIEDSFFKNSNEANSDEFKIKFHNDQISANGEKYLFLCWVTENRFLAEVSNSEIYLGTITPNHTIQYSLIANYYAINRMVFDSNIDSTELEKVFRKENVAQLQKDITKYQKKLESIKNGDASDLYEDFLGYHVYQDEYSYQRNITEKYSRRFDVEHDLFLPGITFYRDTFSLSFLDNHTPQLRSVYDVQGMRLSHTTIDTPNPDSDFTDYLSIREPYRSPLPVTEKTIKLLFSLAGAIIE